MKELGILFLVLIVFLLLALSTPSCDGPQKYSRASLSAVAGSIVYFRDKTTGLCFAYAQPQDDKGKSGLLANVPCETVLGQLVEP
jgi:hypothetical protein